MRPISPIPRDLASRLFLVLGFAGLAFLFSGCATHRDAHSKSAGGPSFAEPQLSRFGTVAFAEESCPASISFQKAKGKKGSVREAIWDSAELGLSSPGAGVIVAGEMLTDTECGRMGGDPIGEAA